MATVVIFWWWRPFAFAVVDMSPSVLNVDVQTPRWTARSVDPRSCCACRMWIACTLPTWYVWSFRPDTKRFLCETGRRATNVLSLGRPCSGSCVHLVSLRGLCQGDSRAVLFKRAGGRLKPTAVTRDHKPNLPSETKRILLAGQ